VLNLRISQRNQELSLKTQELALKAQEQTLETRQAQLFMGIFQTFASKEFQTDMESMVWDWNWKDYDDYMKKYGMANVVENGKHATVFTHYEGTGVLVKRGLINPELVYDLMYSSVIALWEKFRPLVQEWRRIYTTPYMYQDFEFLYEEMKKIRERRGNQAFTRSPASP